jgi:hypothetical protein
MTVFDEEGDSHEVIFSHEKTCHLQLITNAVGEEEEKILQMMDEITAPFFFIQHLLVSCDLGISMSTRH